MKATRTAIVFFAFLAMVISTQNSRAQLFEGKIKYSVTTESKTLDLTYLTKGERMKIEIPKGTIGSMDEISAIIDFEDEQAIMLLKAQKMAIVMPMANLSDAAGGGFLRKQESSENDADNINAIRTGKTQTMLGYECQQWLITSNEEGKKEAAVEIWTAKSLGGIKGFSKISGKIPAWMRATADEMVGTNGGLPLLVIIKDSKGKEKFRIEAKNVITNAVKDSDFQAPAGFTILNPGTMKQEADEIETESEE